MPDVGRQIWEIGSFKRCRAHPIEKNMSKNKTKILKKELRELENKKNDEKREMNKKTMKNDLSKMILG